MLYACQNGALFYRSAGIKSVTSQKPNYSVQFPSMKYDYLVLFLLCCLLPPEARAQQPDSFRLLRTLPGEIRYATADNLGNTYIINAGNAVEKYAPDGSPLARYTNNRLGVPAYLDVSNPLKILVWYADFRKIVFLNRSGTELGELDLIALGYPDVRTVAAAQDGNIWLYDETAFLLRKISPEGEALFESQNLSLLGQERLVIACIRDDGNQVYLSNTNEGLIILDAYAQSCRTRLSKGIGDFQVLGEKLLYLKDYKLQIEDLKAFTKTEIPLPGGVQPENRRFWLGTGRLFVHDGNFLSVYSF